MSFTGIVDKPRKLSKKRLGVIIEALTERLAGAIETEFEIDDYREALKWAQQKHAALAAKPRAGGPGKLISIEYDAAGNERARYYERARFYRGAPGKVPQ